MKKIIFSLLVFTLITLAGCASVNEDYYRESNFDASYANMMAGEPGTTKYTNDSDSVIVENPIQSPSEVATSTFSIDVDTASYSIFRKYLGNYRLPDSDQIRTEEMVNYFDYDHPEPVLDVPFAVHTELAPCPWNSESNLLMIGIQGKDVALAESKPNNLVFLIDVSGSMRSSGKLEMVKESLTILVNNLGENDFVSIVTYAGTAETKLMPTSGSDKDTILDTIDSLEASGGTNGSGGIELAYDLAYQTFIFEGNNRVILNTDGDFNIGTTSTDGLISLVTEKAEIGIYLTILGYGQQHSAIGMMESLSNSGQGTYHFIDTLKEADKILNHEVTSAIIPIADDVKIQVEFNEDFIEEYRLIGYENRVLNNEDFDDDEVDAGEMGAGHNVTAFYEIKMKSIISTENEDLVTVKVRYKDVGESESKLVQGVVRQNDFNSNPNSDFLFASAVVETSLLLRESEYKGDASFTDTLSRIENNLGDDPFELRQEFYDLVTSLASIMDK